VVSIFDGPCGSPNAAIEVAARPLLVDVGKTVRISLVDCAKHGENTIGEKKKQACRPERGIGRTPPPLG